VHGRDGTSRTAALLIWLRSLCLVASRERASERARESEHKNKERERVDDEVERGKSRDGALVLQGTDLQTNIHIVTDVLKGLYLLRKNLIRKLDM
jgi:hypothetical protein